MWMHLTFGFLMLVTAVFLILLVLVQRGRGGGLAGALGGMGGQSAFGAKAGDTFTKITVWAATFWILLCMSSIVLLNPPKPKPERKKAEIRRRIDENRAGNQRDRDGAIGASDDEDEAAADDDEPDSDDETDKEKDNDDS
jgi:preprotein translocase subunit SecG